MCFAPQRRALFRHLNFQTWSERELLLAFSLANVLHATTACTFSTSQLAKVVRKWSEPGVFCTFWLRNVLRATTACTFRHLNFQKISEAEVFCTFWLRNVLRATTACNCSSLIWPDCSAPAALASLLFDPPEPQIIGTTQCLATFLPFRASASSFFWLFLFSDLLSSTLLFSLTLPISAFQCFSSVHVVGSLTSNLPSIISPSNPVTSHSIQIIYAIIHDLTILIWPPRPSNSSKLRNSHESGETYETYGARCLFLWLPYVSICSNLVS